MQDFSRSEPLYRLDLTEIAKAVIDHSSFYSDYSLQSSIEEAVSEGRTDILSVVEIEESAYQSFEIEQSEALETIRTECAVVRKKCGIDIELRLYDREGATYHAGVPTFFLADVPAFLRYVEAVRERGSTIATEQEFSLRYVIDSLLLEMRERYRVDGTNDPNAHSFITALPELRKSIEGLATVRSSFLPIATELTVLEWIFEKRCEAEVLSCSRAGGYRMELLCIESDSLRSNHDAEAYHPPCGMWYLSSEDVQVFTRKWRNLEQKLKRLLALPELKDFSHSLITHYKNELCRAKIDIVPDSSALDDPKADLEFRVAIDEIYDRLDLLVQQ